MSVIKYIHKTYIYSFHCVCAVMSVHEGAYDAVEAQNGLLDRRAVGVPLHSAIIVLAICLCQQHLHTGCLHQQYLQRLSLAEAPKVHKNLFGCVVEDGCPWTSAREPGMQHRPSTNHYMGRYTLPPLDAANVNTCCITVIKC